MTKVSVYISEMVRDKPNAVVRGFVSGDQPYWRSKSDLRLQSSNSCFLHYSSSKTIRDIYAMRYVVMSCIATEPSLLVFVQPRLGKCFGDMEIFNIFIWSSLLFDQGSKRGMTTVLYYTKPISILEASCCTICRDNGFFVFFCFVFVETRMPVRPEACLSIH